MDITHDPFWGYGYMNKYQNNYSTRTIKPYWIFLSVYLLLNVKKINIYIYWCIDADKLSIVRSTHVLGPLNSVFMKGGNKSLLHIYRVVFYSSSKNINGILVPTVIKLYGFYNEQNPYLIVSFKRQKWQM